MVEHLGTELTTIFAALGHPVRISIVERLRQGDRRVTDLARPFDVSLAAVSKHVRILERAGILRRRIDGRDHWIGVQPHGLDLARGWFDAEAAFWQGRLDALATAMAGETEDRSTDTGASSIRSSRPRERSA